MGRFECGASLCARFVEGICSFDKDLVDMFRKQDVFKSTLDPRLTTVFNYFRAFIIKDGDCNVSLETVRSMFENKNESLRQGEELFAPVIANTKRLADSAVVVHESEEFKVYLAHHENPAEAIDLMLYQGFIDERMCDKKVLWLTSSDAQRSNGLYNLGIRRAGSGIHVGKLCAAMKA